MAARSSKIPTILLTVLCIALAAVVWLEVRHPPRVEVGGYESVPLSVGEGEEAPPANLVAPLPLNHYKEIIERPLFIAERRPPQEDPEIKEEEPEPENDYVLLGVILLPEGKAALIRVQETAPVDNKKRPRGKMVRGVESKVERLQIGEDVNGWRLETVDHDKVTLRKGEETKNLSLERNRDEPISRQAAPARRAPVDQRVNERLRTVTAKRKAAGAPSEPPPTTPRRPPKPPRAAAPNSDASSRGDPRSRRTSPSN